MIYIWQEQLFIGLVYCSVKGQNHTICRFNMVTMTARPLELELFFFTREVAKRVSYLEQNAQWGFGDTLPGCTTSLCFGVADNVLRFCCSSTQFDPWDYHQWHAGIRRETPPTGATYRASGWTASSWDSDELYSSYKYIMSTPDGPNMTDLSRLSAITSLVSHLHNYIDRPCAFLIASPWPAAMGYTNLRVQ